MEAPSLADDDFWAMDDQWDQPAYGGARQGPPSGGGLFGLFRQSTQWLFGEPRGAWPGERWPAGYSSDEVLHRLTVASSNRIAAARDLIAQGQVEDVEALLQKNTALWAAVETDLLRNPSAVDLQSTDVLIPLQHLTSSLEMVGHFYLMTGRLQDAVQVLERACPLMELLPPPDIAPSDLGLDPQAELRSGPDLEHAAADVFGLEPEFELAPGCFSLLTDTYRRREAAERGELVVDEVLEPGGEDLVAASGEYDGFLHELQLGGNETAAALGDGVDDPHACPQENEVYGTPPSDEDERIEGRLLELRRPFQHLRTERTILRMQHRLRDLLASTPPLDKLAAELMRLSPDQFGDEAFFLESYVQNTFGGSIAARARSVAKARSRLIGDAVRLAGRIRAADPESLAAAAAEEALRVMRSIYEHGRGWLHAEVPRLQRLIDSSDTPEEEVSALVTQLRVLLAVDAAWNLTVASDELDELARKNRALSADWHDLRAAQDARLLALVLGLLAAAALFVASRYGWLKLREWWAVRAATALYEGRPLPPFSFRSDNTQPKTKRQQYIKAARQATAAAARNAVADARHRGAAKSSPAGTTTGSPSSAAGGGASVGPGSSSGAAAASSSAGAGTAANPVQASVTVPLEAPAPVVAVAVEEPVAADVAPAEAAAAPAGGGVGKDSTSSKERANTRAARKARSNAGGESQRDRLERIQREDASLREARRKEASAAHKRFEKLILEEEASLLERAQVLRKGRIAMKAERRETERKAKADRARLAKQEAKSEAAVASRAAAAGSGKGPKAQDDHILSPDAAPFQIPAVTPVPLQAGALLPSMLLAADEEDDDGSLEPGRSMREQVQALLGGNDGGQVSLDWEEASLGYRSRSLSPMPVDFVPTSAPGPVSPTSWAAPPAAATAAPGWGAGDSSHASQIEPPPWSLDESDKIFAAADDVFSAAPSEEQRPKSTQPSPTAKLDQKPPEAASLSPSRSAPRLHFSVGEMDFGTEGGMDFDAPLDLGLIDSWRPQAERTRKKGSRFVTLEGEADEN